MNIIGIPLLVIIIKLLLLSAATSKVSFCCETQDIPYILLFSVLVCFFIILFYFLSGYCYLHISLNLFTLDPHVLITYNARLEKENEFLWPTD